MKRTKLIVVILLPILVTGSAFLMTLQTVPPSPSSKSPQAVLLTSANELTNAIISPDGKHVAYASNETGSFEVWVIDSTGAHITRVTYLAGDAVFPRYSPDGQGIAFLLKTPQGTSLWVAKSDGSNQRSLVNNSAPMNTLAWNPQGQLIAYDSLEGGRWIVSTVDLQGQTKQLTPSGVNSQYPAWTPDGKRIVYSSGEVGGYNIWAMGADGGNRARITSGQENDIKPAVSPTGQKVAFLSRSSAGWSICAVNLDGSGLSDLLGNIFIDAPAITLAVGETSDFAWNPNGKVIAFTTSLQGGAQFVVALDTTSYLPITPNSVLPAPSRLVFNVAFVVNFAQLSTSGVSQSLSWSASGANAVFVTKTGGQWSITNFNFANQKLRSSYG